MMQRPGEVAQKKSRAASGMGRALASAVLFGLLACGSGGPQIPEELLDCDCQSEGEYPPGPYGAELGDTIEDFSFRGLQNPEVNEDWKELRFSDYYDPQGEKGLTLLLLNTAAVWCQPCVIEHSDLPSRAEQYKDEGLAVFSALFQDADAEPADEATLLTWTRTFGTNFAMALDPSYQMGRFGPAASPPLNLVVDPRDMKILARFIGYQDEPLWTFIEDELAARKEE